MIDRSFATLRVDGLTFTKVNPIEFDPLMKEPHADLRMMETFSRRARISKSDLKLKTVTSFPRPICIDFLTYLHLAYPFPRMMIAARLVREIFNRDSSQLHQLARDPARPRCIESSSAIRPDIDRSVQQETIEFRYSIKEHSLCKIVVARVFQVIDLMLECRLAPCALVHRVHLTTCIEVLVGYWSYNNEKILGPPSA